MIKIGISISSKVFALDIPTGITLTGISGGVKIDWTDTNSGNATTEIWGKNDSDPYALLYTVAAGTVTKNDTCTPVDLRYYKIRAKQGSKVSDFSAESSIALLGTEMMPSLATYMAVGGAWWNRYFQACWSGDGTKLIDAGGTGFIGRDYFWTTGKTYRTIVSATIGAVTGDLRMPYDGTLQNGPFPYVSTTYTTYYTTAGEHMHLFAASWTGNITAISIKNVLYP